MEAGSGWLGMRNKRNPMSEISAFESRSGIVSCNAEELYYFLSDIRNFERFIPKDKFSEIKIDSESCSFNVSLLGRVDIHIGSKREFTEITYSGHAMQVNDFSLKAGFRSHKPASSEVRLTIIANLNPFLKMLAAEPVKTLLETLITEMEKFNGWKDIRAEK
jgi:hypothetical protein